MSSKIVLAQQLSFCFGVKKSLDLLEDLIQSKKYKKIYMLGEIIHNTQVINDLKSKGIKIIKDIHKIPPLPKNSLLVIQSHGVGPEVYDKLKQRNITYIDSTCPLVKRIHQAIETLELENYYPVILGSAKHTEVIGIKGYVKHNPIIIKSVEEVGKINWNKIDKVGIVMQSTFFYDKADDIIKAIKKKVKEVKVIDTICEPTKLRQKEIVKEASRFKSVAVIGSHNSSNTNKLYDLAKKKNKNTFFIASEKEVEQYDFSKNTPIFLASGASAPTYLIQGIKNKILKQSNSFFHFSKLYVPTIESKIEDVLLEKRNESKDRYMQFIFDMLQDFCLRPGKRIRPLLVLWGYLAFGGEKSKMNDLIDVAASVEMMHASLLIHDDIIDEAELRRGDESFHYAMNDVFLERTYNKNVGRDLAIVAGDILYFLAFGLASQIQVSAKKKNKFLKYFSQCYSYTAEGQLYDIFASRLRKIKPGKTYSKQINLLKTSYYTIYYPIIMGYSLTGKTSIDIKTIEKIAVPLGLAFQMRDDIMSTFGNEEDTGKPNDSDIKEGKMTVLIEKTLEVLSDKDRKFFEDLFLKEEKTEKDIKQIKEIIKQTGTLEKVKKEIIKLLNQSIRRIKDLNIKSEYKNIFLDLIELLTF